MKTINKLTLLAGLGMTVASISLHAQTDPVASRIGDRPARPPHAHFGQVLEGVVLQYDANQDGRLDKAEMANLLQEVAAGKVTPPGRFSGAGPRGFSGPTAHVSSEVQGKHHANWDGRPDAADREVLHRGPKAPNTPPPGLRQRPDGPMGAHPSAAQILERFDVDTDGKLDKTELAAFLDSRPAPGPLYRQGSSRRPIGNRPPGDGAREQ